MRNRLSYFFEMIFLVPVFPILYFRGKKLIGAMVKLPPRSEFQKIEGRDPNYHLLIIGESTAAGVGASSPDTTFASQIFNHSEGKYSIHNLGKNGLRAKELFGLFQKSEVEVATSFTKTIILIGANDCFKFTPPRRFSKEMETFILFLIRDKGVKNIIIPLIPPVQVFPGIPRSMRFFLGWHRGILTKELKMLEKNILQLSFENYESDTAAGFYAEDGIHPSDLGYELIAKTIATKIQ
ncbi:SGNH/GDSL hydrolase family protein [Aquiflexum sp. TKW24L]|uniref:SGNH/GDSL hydrolase family protein n=1 Tax=Aquiflexum sp. TKW24L TaxID=2942212 RepID=UPI0020BF4AC5|nr:SGNH/GDSL hydrolase family protein [Aquiflexum sp. TKW24L]MCL6260184.1 SGNH/GDSL hydrolase family protein [Aquiflexum sp. TKW24L]